MTARPLLQRLSATIESLGGIEWFCSEVASGESLGKLRHKILGPDGKPVSSRAYLYNWLKQKGHEYRWEAYQEALALSGEARAEKGEEILDSLAERPFITAPEVSLANSRANYQRYLAGVRDDRFSDKRGAVNVNLSLGDLHLDALRAVRTVQGTPIPEAEGVVLLGSGDNEEDDDG